MSDFENPILIIGDEIIEPLGIISVEAPQQCDLCGTVAELRPYGPNGEAICHPCGMKNPEATKRQFMRRMECAQEKLE